MLKSPYNIDPRAGFSEAACIALRTQAEALFQNLDGTREGDVESLHDMRVASRRLRAAMSVFASAFPARRFRPLEREAARITDALGAVRDADVQIEYLEKSCLRMSVAERVGMTALIDELKARREQDREDLVKELARLKKSDFLRDLEETIASVGPAHPRGASIGEHADG